jgi:hypothetical protein
MIHLVRDDVRSYQRHELWVVDALVVVGGLVQLDAQGEAPSAASFLDTSDGLGELALQVRKPYISNA